MQSFIFTLLCAAFIGFLFYKLKIPGGMMVGAIVGVVALNLLTSKAYMPSTAKMAAQMVSGAFIGVGISRNDLKRLKQIAKPMAVLAVGMLVLNLVMGFILSLTGSMDLLTAFFCAVPGGMSDTPIIAAEMGADGAKVAIMQFARLCAGIGVFPSMIQYFTKNQKNVEKGSMKIEKTPYSHGGFAITAAAAAAGGIVGKLTGIPAGILLFALIFSLIAKQLYTKCMLPVWTRRCAQILAGAYIGTSINASDIPAMKQLIVPSIILILGYFAACMVISHLLHKHCGLSLKEGMLAATPAGASDMALISADVGVSSPDVIVLQIGRMLCAVTIFPQIIMFITSQIK